MIKRTLFSFMLVCLVVTVAIAPTAVGHKKQKHADTVTLAAASLLWDRSFESTKGTFQPWYNINSLTRTTERAHNSTYSLRIDGKAFWGIEEAWPGSHSAVGNTQYTYKGWLRAASGSHGVEVSAFYVDGSGNLAGERTVTTNATANSTGWTQFSGTVTSPAGAATVGLRFEDSDGGVFYLDDLEAWSVDSTATPTPTQTPTPTPTPTETVTPTPTPTPTSTPTPTPTPTTSPTPTPFCSNPDTIQEGAGRTYGEYFVHNNNWNDNYGGTHVIHACSAQQWNVDVNVPNHSDMAVEAYPNVHKDYNDAPLSSIDSARFAGTGPDCAGCVYNVAFDVWINNGFTNELMIWTKNHGQTPAGTRLADTVIGGHTYQVWKTGGANSSGGIFTYVSVPAQLSGTMPLNLFWQDLQQRGWIPANSTTWQVDFGVETVTTAGTTRRFDFTDFAINDTP